MNSRDVPVDDLFPDCDKPPIDPEETPVPRDDRGLYDKFTVERNHPHSKDVSTPCRYFVLDIPHDPYAVPALTAYAHACERTHPQLADDLRALLVDPLVPHDDDPVEGYVWCRYHGAVHERTHDPYDEGHSAARCGENVWVSIGLRGDPP